jgi:phosphoribosylamine--glycine ligase/phosphoribosylformylglycinamidine cyclo-ligase
MQCQLQVSLVSDHQRQVHTFQRMFASSYCLAAARLEASKAFTKDFMARHGIRTARYQNFNAFEPCKAYIESLDYPVVVKFSGLAAGKGVIIPANQGKPCYWVLRRIVEGSFF